MIDRSDSFFFLSLLGRTLIAALLFVLSLGLFCDGMIFAQSVENPGNGRLGGVCYTLLDDLLATREPWPVLRLAQLLSPMLALGLSFLLFMPRSSGRIRDEGIRGKSSQ
jgi:hypothetical protein